MQRNDGSIAYELLLQSLLWSGRGLSARLQLCAAAKTVLGVSAEQHEQALQNVHHNSSHALLALVQQLHWLHEQVALHTAAQGSTHATHAAADGLALCNFSSRDGYQAWLRFSWESMQQQLWQLQQVPRYSGELQLQLQGASIHTHDQQRMGCFSCLCSHTLEPQPHSPYCVVWLKNNTAAQSSSSVGSHTSPESGPLGLLASSGAVTAAAVGTNFANAGLAAAKTARPPSQGAQTQCSGVVEDCNEPLWNSVLQYHVASSDAVLRLQVRSSTSTGATLEWFRTSLAASGVLAQGASTFSKLASLTDSFIGQISIQISSLQQAMQKAHRQRQHQAEQRRGSPSAASGVTQHQLHLVLPLYGPSTAGSHGAAAGNTERNISASSGIRRSSRKVARHDQVPGAQYGQVALPEFLADALQEPGCTAAVVKQGKVPLPAKAVPSQGAEHLVLHDPCTGTSSDVGGRAMVGEVRLLGSYRVEQQLQPDATAVIAATEVPVAAMLEALEVQGCSVPLPQPLCHAAMDYRSGGFNATESEPAASTTAGGTPAEQLGIAAELVTAVWKLWQQHALADSAAAYEAALLSATGPAACGRSTSPAGSTKSACLNGAGGSCFGVNAPSLVRVAADMLPLSTQGSWSLPAVRQLPTQGAVGSTSAPRDGFASSHNGGESFLDSTEGPRQSCSVGGFASMAATSACGVAGSNEGVSATGCKFLQAGDSRSVPLALHPQLQLTLQRSTSAAATAAGSMVGQGMTQVLQDQAAAWFAVLQTQQQCLSHVLERPSKQQATAVAAAVLQHLSLQSLMGGAACSRAACKAAALTDDGRAADVPALPGVYYLQLLSDAAVIGGLRPAAVRIALLQKLLQSWWPDEVHLLAVLDVVHPLLIADRQQLLTTAESAVLQGVAGGLMHVVQQVLCSHYDMYTTQSSAAACLPLLLALLAALSGSASQQQLAEAATPCFAAAAQHRFLPLLDPDAAVVTAAAIASVTAQLAGAAAASGVVADSSTAADGGHGGAGVQTCEVELVAEQQPAETPGPPGIFDMLKFRELRPRFSHQSAAEQAVAGRASDVCGATADDLAACGRKSTPSGLFSTFLDIIHQPRQSSMSGLGRESSNGLPVGRHAARQPAFADEQQEGSASADTPGIPFWSRGRQQSEQHQQQQQHSNAAGLFSGRQFWRHSQQQPAQNRSSTAGPIAEGLLRSDSDEALEAACRGLESSSSGSSQTAQGAAAATPAKAIVAPTKAGSDKLWGSLGGNTSRPGSLAGALAPAAMPASSLAAVVVGPSAAGHSTSGKAAPAVDSQEASFVLHTKLLYEPLDSPTRSSNTTLPNRRSTLQNVGYFGISSSACSVTVTTAQAPAPGETCSTNSAAGPLQLNRPAVGGRHARTGSLGALDGVLSRFGRQHTRTAVERLSSAADPPATQPNSLEQGSSGLHDRLSTASAAPTVAAKSTSSAVEVSASSGSDHISVTNTVASRLLGRGGSSSRHGRSGSCGSLSLWENCVQKTVQQDNAGNAGGGWAAAGAAEGCVASQDTSEVNRQQPSAVQLSESCQQGIQSSAAAIAVATASAGASFSTEVAPSCSRSQDAAWQRSAMNVTVAMGVVLEELERDIQLQANLPAAVQLPLIGLHVRYSLMHSHIDSLLACGHELNYDTTVRELEKALRKLNDELLRQGWAVMPSSSTAAAALAVHPGQRLGKAGALPCRDAAGNLPPVVLCDLDGLMAPIWEAWLRSSSQHLMSVVDGLIAAQAQQLPVASAGSTGSSGVQGGGLAAGFSADWGGRAGGWTPVAAEQGCLYSSSVVDLFFHLQGLADQVLQLAVRPVRSFNKRAANIRLLSGMTTAAIERYTAHLHAAAAALLRSSQVVVPPGRAVQSGKTTRHRRGDSVGVVATPRQASTPSAAPHKHERTQSALPASMLGQGSILSGPTGGSTKTEAVAGGSLPLQKCGSFGKLASVASGSDCVTPDSFLHSFASAAWMSLALGSSPVVQPEVCVVLNSLQECLHQQQLLDQQLWEELATGASSIDAGSNSGAGEAAGTQEQQQQQPRSHVTGGRVPVAPPTSQPLAQPSPATCKALQRSNALPHSVPDSTCTPSVPAVTARTSSDDEQDAEGCCSDADSDVSELLLTEDEIECRTQSDQLPAVGPQDSHVEQRWVDPPPPAAAPDAAMGQSGRMQQGQLPWQAAGRQSRLAATADVKHRSAALSDQLVALLAEVVQVIREQLQGHRVALLASLLHMCSSTVAAAAATAATAGVNVAAPSSSSIAAASPAASAAPAVAAAAKEAAGLLAHDPSVQLLLASVTADMDMVCRQCSPAVAQQLLKAHWQALLDAVLQLALCQAGSSVQGVNLAGLQLLQLQHVVLLQQLLLVLQTEVCQAMVGHSPFSQLEHLLAGSSATSALPGPGGSQMRGCSSGEAVSAIEGVAVAAVRARTVLQLLLQPTTEVIQQFLDMQRQGPVVAGANGSSNQLTRVDVLRCLRQRVSDPEARVFLHMQLRKAGSDVMGLLFGLPAAETVQVFASCTTAAGTGVACSGGSTAGKLGSLRTAFGNSSATAGVAAGCLYLSAGHLAFTDLVADSHTDEDDGTFATRMGKLARQMGSPSLAPRKAAAAVESATAGAAAGPTGSSGSPGLGTKPWWKNSSGSTSGSATATQQLQAADAVPASAVAADTTFMIPLSSVARLDKIYYKAEDALAVTMLDRSSRVFHGFESAAVRDELHNAVRLTVMGTNTPLDRSLRCFEDTVAALDLGLPITERVIRVHQCFKYGTVRNKSGNLYLCSSLLAFDYDDSEAPKAVQGSSGSTRNTVGQSSSAVAGDAGGSVAATTLGCSRTADSSAGVLLAVGSRMVIRYQDIIHLRQEKASWADKHWLMIQFSGPQGHAALAELGGGSQGMVADILADISRIMAAAGH